MGDYKQCLLLACYIVVANITTTSSRTSTLWKLSSDHSKIVEVNQLSHIKLSGGPKEHFMAIEDPVFNIITSTVHYGHLWSKPGINYYCNECHLKDSFLSDAHNGSDFDPYRAYKQLERVLDCGKPVNFTYFDNLVGIMNRNEHPNVAEPQVALIFQTNKNEKPTKQDLLALEKRLRKLRKEMPQSVTIYNQIGNLWRLRGDSLKSIECFRRALNLAPNDSEALLNLARVLYNLQYLDDAIFLTRRSLETQPPDRGAWQQYFTLGEIFKAYGRYQEATVHMRHTLELNPEFEPAQLALEEIESAPPATIHYYTFVIIVCLVMGVLLVILSSVDSLTDGEGSDSKPRHFNKAMAMRSLRGLAQRNVRIKKTAN